MLGASAGVRETLLSMTSGGDKVLDIGCGNAEIYPYLRQKYKEIWGVDCDLYPNQKQYDHFKQIDLNKRTLEVFEKPGMFDSVVAVELVEHLENQRQFLRDCKRLIKDSGEIIFTTPNPECYMSRSMFATMGKFQWFTDLDNTRSGHITPLFPFQLAWFCRDVGLKITNFAYNDFYTQEVTIYRLVKEGIKI
jgi:2-polyprenyl-3-methyl-5-hydroxy-6-metoxy-1,4-benzoquinol methylase